MEISGRRLYYFIFMCCDDLSIADIFMKFIVLKMVLIFNSLLAENYFISCSVSDPDSE